MILRIVCVCVCALCLTVLGCKYQWPAQSASPVDIAASASLQLGPLQLGSGARMGSVVYVTPVEGATSLSEHIARGVEARGYSVTGQPSLADYVIYIHIISAGEADVALARQAVQAGYAQKAHIAGAGTAVLIADVLVAARSLPQASKPLSPVVAATSSRHIVAEKEARLGAFMPQTRYDKGHFALEQGLANAIVEAIAQRRTAPSAQ